MIKICALQLATLSMSENRIDYYMKIAHDNGAKIVVLGEYTLNSFFTELKHMPSSITQKQSEHKMELMQNLAKKYDLNIIAPIIRQSGSEASEIAWIKSCAHFSPSGVKFYNQTMLINYSHWNEDEFFLNAKIHKNGKFEPLIFEVEGVKFGVCFGFEAHFDMVWQRFDHASVDCVLIPTASTFESNLRWAELLKMRAFTHSAYIVRTNRIGEAKFGDMDFKFYGGSFLANPYGEIINELKGEEGALMCEIDPAIVREATEFWGFKANLKNKGFA
ncbi:carbon-nitrogen hydrolase family protein [Campylobacter sp. JMF_01 NE2]|uniref:carbon-nitrogen hydrolase family protein n=1 Tax=unclassified Campylobacter TaxID=2593542 RepID=UPI0022E9EBA5|nr:MULTISPECIES: carbon-nitrogen hydrolase family protein [unclassified Campylobacter]MDA3052959.1 carbon-nitrogen hydrolase family protein [Campylobacter sp. JMF_03 NE3]MDA3067290.1 carbon-nitrogen hydrolase family protein [Campylobacter sp. JMF_01 NE2]